jgi:hypothetical protein
MDVIDFGAGANTPTGDLFSAAIIKLTGRIGSLDSGALLGEFGINIQGMDPYNRALVPVDLMRAGQLRLTDYNNVYDPSIDVVSPRVNASDIGMDAYGWPTTSPSGKQVMVAFDCANRGFSADQSGTYDVTFPPGLDWSVAGDCGMSRTAYNLAAGTATIVIVPNVSGVSPRFVFNSYNGVANTFPPYSPSRAFKAIKRGEDLDGFLTKASLDSIFGITSAAKPHTGFKGWVRIMTPNAINRQAQTNTTYNRTRTTPDVNRLGVATGSGQFLIEHQLQMAIKRGANLWVNLPDTNTIAANKRIAQYLYDNVPAGMRFVVEWSNEIYFNFFGPFAQTGDLFQRSKVNYPPNGTLQRQYGIEVRQYMVEPFEQVFSFNDPRYIPVVGVQSAQANYGFINQVFIDAGDLKTRIKGICTGPYIAGGIAGVNIGNYTEQSVFTKASRDKAGVDDAGFIDDMFAAQTVMSQKTYNQNHKTFLADKARYATDNGMSADRYMTLSYEFSWQHYNMSTNHKISLTGAINGTTLTVSANSGPPLRVNDVLVKSDITSGTTVVRQISGTPGGAGDYEVSVSQTSASGTITSSTNMYARAVGRLLAQALRDPRAGAAQVEQIQWLRRDDGGIHCLFDHAGSLGSLWDDNANAPVNSGSNWGMEDRIGNEAIDDPYKTVSAYLQANG